MRADIAASAPIYGKYWHITATKLRLRPRPGKIQFFFLPITPLLKVLFLL